VLLAPTFETHASESLITRENVSSAKRIYPLTAKPDHEKRLSEIVGHPDNPALSGLLANIALQPIEISDVLELEQSRGALVAHARHRLADTEKLLSTEEAGMLVLALSLVKDDEALSLIVKMGNRFVQETGFTRQLLLILRDLPVNDQIQSYVDNLLEHGRDNPELLRSALLYYAAVQHPSAMRWAAYYRTPGIDPKIRFAGLYLASVLSKDATVKQWLLDEVSRQSPVPAYQQYYLLRAYRFQAEDAEFDHIASKFSTAPSVLQHVQREDEFVAAEQEIKPSLAKHLLNSPHYEQQRIALLFWLAEGKLPDIWAQLDSRKRLMAIRLAISHDIKLWPEQSQETYTAEQPDYSKYFLVGSLIFLVLMTVTAIRSIFNRGSAGSTVEKSGRNQIAANR
jgi:hypothetical protein